jgi:hypothetical protein
MENYIRGNGNIGKFETFEPIDNKNSEKYRSSLLTRMGAAKFNIIQCEKEIKKINETSFILGLIRKKHNENMIESLKYLIESETNAINKIQIAYDYALKHKKKDGQPIYKESSTSFDSVKIYK